MLCLSDHQTMAFKDQSTIPKATFLERGVFPYNLTVSGKVKIFMPPGPYIAGGRRGQLPPPGKLNVFFLTQCLILLGCFLQLYWSEISRKPSLPPQTKNPRYGPGLPRRVQCFQTLHGNDVLRGSSRVPAPRTNLYRDYSKSLTLSNLGKPSKVEFLRTIPKFRNKGKFRRCSCISSVHREIGHFHVVVLSCSVCKRDRLIKPGCFSTERGCSKESDSFAPQRSSVAVREKSLRPAKS